MTTNHRLPLLLAVCFGAGILTGAACSSSDSGLPVTDGGTGKAGTGGGAAGSGGEGGAAGGGGAGGGGGSVPDAGGGGKGGGPPPFDAGMAPDVSITDAPPPSPGKIDCGSMECDAEKQICCGAFTGGMDLKYACLPKGSPCPGINKRCDGKEDCDSGKLCCIKLTSMSAEVRCVDETNCTGGMGPSGGYPMCHTNSDCPADRPNCCGISYMGQTYPVCSMYKC